jgi:hypothetical protein
MLSMAQPIQRCRRLAIRSAPKNLQRHTNINTGQREKDDAKPEPGWVSYCSRWRRDCRRRLRCRSDRRWLAAMARLPNPSDDHAKSAPSSDHSFRSRPERGRLPQEGQSALLNRRLLPLIGHGSGFRWKWGMCSPFPTIHIQHK